MLMFLKWMNISQTYTQLCSCNYLTTCYKYNYVLSGGCTDNHVYVHVAICMIEYVESMTIQLNQYLQNQLLCYNFCIFLSVAQNSFVSETKTHYDAANKSLSEQQICDSVSIPLVVKKGRGGGGGGRQTKYWQI